MTSLHSEIPETDGDGYGDGYEDGTGDG